MALRVLTSEAVEAADLPLAELAARMRMPEGWETIPDQVTRLESRMRSALLATERRLGHVLLQREIRLVGTSDGVCTVALPVAPVAALISVEVDRGDAFKALTGVRLRDGALELPNSVEPGAGLRVAVDAGYGAWADVPDDLAEVVLLISERGESGDRTMEPAIERAMAPFRNLRLGRTR